MADIPWHPLLPPVPLAIGSLRPAGLRRSWQPSPGEKPLRRRAGSGNADEVTLTFGMDTAQFTFFQWWWVHFLAAGSHDILMFDSSQGGVRRLTVLEDHYEARRAGALLWDVTLTCRSEDAA
jgi:hypothetical protein